MAYYSLRNSTVNTQFKDKIFKNEDKRNAFYSKTKKWSEKVTTLTLKYIDLLSSKENITKVRSQFDFSKYE